MGQGWKNIMRKLIQIIRDKCNDNIYLKFIMHFRSNLKLSRGANAHINILTEQAKEEFTVYTEHDFLNSLFKNRYPDSIRDERLDDIDRYYNMIHILRRIQTKEFWCGKLFPKKYKQNSVRK